MQFYCTLHISSLLKIKKMKKTNIIFVGIIAFTAFSCGTTIEGPEDLEAPMIEHAEAEDEISPDHNEIFGETADHIPISFSVEDPSGIGQIKVNVHANFDGHSHARVKNDFMTLSVDDIYSVDASDPDFRFPANSTKVNIDSPENDIYWSGPNSRLSGPVMAGKYDFSIAATDVFGNQTGFADGSSYLTTIHIRTPYAPHIAIDNLTDDELVGTGGETLNVEGEIHRTGDALSAPLAFIWIKLGEEHDDHDDHDHDDHDGHDHRVSSEEYAYDKMWGKSQWLSEGEGPDLPNTENLDLGVVLSGDNAIMLPTSEDHMELTITAEDTNGNTTEKTYHVEIE